MDETQKKIAKALNENSNCLKDATMLKNVLADAVPNDKIHSNLVLEAYNEGIFKCFFEKDPTLSLLQFIPMLVNNYGISEDNAIWSVVTWCYVFSRTETAEALLKFMPSNQNKSGSASSNSHNSGTENGVIMFGMYKAGNDFPVGTVRVNVEYEDADTDDLYMYYSTGKDPTHMSKEIKMSRQVYIEIKQGEYVEFKRAYDAVKNIHYEKISD